MAFHRNPASNGLYVQVQLEGVVGLYVQVQLEGVVGAAHEFACNEGRDVVQETDSWGSVRFVTLEVVDVLRFTCFRSQWSAESRLLRVGADMPRDVVRDAYIQSGNTIIDSMNFLSDLPFEGYEAPTLRAEPEPVSPAHTPPPLAPTPPVSPSHTPPLTMSCTVPTSTSFVTQSSTNIPGSSDGGPKPTDLNDTTAQESSEIHVELPANTLDLDPKTTGNGSDIYNDITWKSFTEWDDATWKFYTDSRGEDFQVTLADNVARLADAFPNILPEVIECLLVENKNNHRQVGEILAYQSTEEERNAAATKALQESRDFWSKAKIKKPAKVPKVPQEEEPFHCVKSDTLSMAEQLWLNKLLSEYGFFLDQSALESIFYASNRNFEGSRQIIKSVFPGLFEPAKPAEHANSGMTTKLPKAKPNPPSKNNAKPSPPSTNKPPDRSPSISLEEFHRCQEWHASQIHYYARQAASAYSSGSGELAQKFSQLMNKERQELARLKSVALQSVKNEVERNVNLTYGRSCTVDLHGCTVQMALAVVSGILKKGKHKKLYFITGAGTHSQDNKPRLFPAIRQWLAAHRYTYSTVDNALFEVLTH
ncbi:hypothetical protein Pelo_8202 [Pelomyxa schiedti]|nr:hypothetical protein Pelo_8202 [Pelomyxa schiedti]